ncbi:hypothetical protein An12g09690 [Aspergillus niger]|uniref:Uncharacterized protein n=2 Tax=Aspergillus niger TaxID=5061 RepID=A2R0T3_ASPNC|nr:hypothetical protein An12g09690 [Aspergillus niger]CAL00875.1 hypothetical protein An12g09690 [Aspergillus niger]
MDHEGAVRSIGSSDDFSIELTIFQLFALIRLTLLEFPSSARLSFLVSYHSGWSGHRLEPKLPAGKCITDSSQM